MYIEKNEYIRLLIRDKELELLEISGVDNWEWYGESFSEANYDEDSFREELEKEFEDEKKEAIYEFDVPERYSMIAGMFVANKKDVVNATGKEVRLGEVAGKHSYIEGPLEKDDIRLITDNPDAIEIFKKYNLSIGYNPLKIIEDYGEEEE